MEENRAEEAAYFREMAVVLVEQQLDGRHGSGERHRGRGTGERRTELAPRRPEEDAPMVLRPAGAEEQRGGTEFL
eukprot:7753861-Heterocapsa_arctica.AAC.1